jgi:hypothetical protein
MERAPRHRSQILHTVIVAAAWVLFVAFWIEVVGRTSAETMALSVAVVGVSLMVTVGLTTLWIYHNLRIFRKKGPRRSVPRVVVELRSDFLGRRLAADWDELKHATLIGITSEPGTKRYEARGGRVGATRP